MFRPCSPPLSRLAPGIAITGFSRRRSGVPFRRCVRPERRVNEGRIGDSRRVRKQRTNHVSNSCVLGKPDSAGRRWFDRTLAVWQTVARGHAKPRKGNHRVQEGDERTRRRNASRRQQQQQLPSSPLLPRFRSAPANGGSSGNHRAEVSTSHFSSDAAADPQLIPSQALTIGKRTERVRSRRVDSRRLNLHALANVGFWTRHLRAHIYSQ
jgi:hypothetical protein